MAITKVHVLQQALEQWCKMFPDIKQTYTVYAVFSFHSTNVPYS